MSFGHGDLVGSSSITVYFFICREENVSEEVISSTWKNPQISAPSILPIIGSLRSVEGCYCPAVLSKGEKCYLKHERLEKIIAFFSFSVPEKN